MFRSSDNGHTEMHQFNHLKDADYFRQMSDRPKFTQWYILAYILYYIIEFTLYRQLKVCRIDKVSKFKQVTKTKCKKRQHSRLEHEYC